jgi:hypothetical protein
MKGVELTLRQLCLPHRIATTPSVLTGEAQSKGRKRCSGFGRGSAHQQNERGHANTCPHLLCRVQAFFSCRSLENIPMVVLIPAPVLT